MALKPCRECGRDVGTEAASCPHCGTPDPTGEKRRAAAEKSERDTKQTQSCLGCVGVMILVPFVLLIIGTLAGGDEQPAGGAPSSSTPPELAASARVADGQVHVTNTSSTSWTNCKIELNGGVIRDGWSQSIGRIGAGATASGGLLAFTKSNGERFNPLTHQLQDIWVRCDEGFWSGTWR